MNFSNIPLVRQQERSECGLACLTMVLNHYGDKRTLADLRTDTINRGTNLKTLIEIAENNNLQPTPLRIKLNDLKYLDCPVILHWERKHFVVLVKIRKNKYYINDPALGRVVYSYDEISEKFTGVILELNPTKNFRAIKVKKKINWRNLLGDSSGLSNSLSKILVIAFILELLLLLSPFYMQIVIDDILAGDDIYLLNILLIAFTFVLLLQIFMKYLRSWYTKALIVKIGLKWENRLFSKLLNLPLEYFNNRSLGEVLSRFTSINTIKSFLGGNIIEVVMDGVMSVLVVVILLMYSKALVLISIISLCLYYIVRVSFHATLTKHIDSEYTAKAKQDTHSVETIRGIQTLKLFAGEKERLYWWNNLITDALNEGLKLTQLRLNFTAIKNYIAGMERLVVIWYSAHLVLNNSFSVGMLVAYIAYRDIFANKLGLLVDRFMDFKLLKVHARKLEDITETKPERSAGNSLKDKITSIKVSNLSFKYAKNEPLAVNKINFEILSGEAIAIVGPSGCGKTTLVKLLTGLLPTSAGTIMINNEDLNTLNLKSYRLSCGTVMQDDQLFSGSISQNISFFCSNMDMDKVIKAAQLASIYDDIMQMPMQFNTLVGDMGSTFSGGQKQIIIFARAMYKNPDLLILDEATSHLDRENEKNINKSISGIANIKIIISHRKESISHADRILVMNNGEIVQQCSPREYLAKF